MSDGDRLEKAFQDIKAQRLRAESAEAKLAAIQILFDAHGLIPKDFRLKLKEILTG